VVNVRVATIESLENGGAVSAPNAQSKFRYTESVPSAVRALTVSTNDTSVSVHWRAPLSSGGPSITHYKVSAAAVPVGGHRAPTVTVVTKPSARSARLTGLRAGWTYLVTVRAENGRGAGLVGTSKQVVVRQPA
jgi:hypothetical protein